MRKLLAVILVLYCLILKGCGNSFSEEDYESNHEVAGTSDNYAKGVSVSDHMDGGYSYKTSKFNGYETLWSESIEESQEMDVTFSFSLAEGKAKVVYIDPEDTITTLFEFTPDTSTDEPVIETLSLQSGKNRIKIVGCDCKDLKLKMLYEEPE